MPKAFEDCVKGGGRVRTVSGPNKKFHLTSGQYRHVCFPKGGGASQLGEIKTNKKADEVEK